MHLVLEVQAEKAVENATDRLMEETRRMLDKEKIGIAASHPRGHDGHPAEGGQGGGAGQGPARPGRNGHLDKVPGATPDELRLTLQAARGQADRGAGGPAEPGDHPEPGGPVRRDRAAHRPRGGPADRGPAPRDQGPAARHQPHREDGPARTEGGGHAAQSRGGGAGEGDAPAGPAAALLSARWTTTSRWWGSGRSSCSGSPSSRGASLTSAEVRPDDQGGWLVAFAWTARGRRSSVTSRGPTSASQLAIVLDDTVYSAPVIRSKIGEGRGQIEGNFTAGVGAGPGHRPPGGRAPGPGQDHRQPDGGAIPGAGFDRRRACSAAILAGHHGHPPHGGLLQVLRRHRRLRPDAQLHHAGGGPGGDPGHPHPARASRGSPWGSGWRWTATS